MDQDKDRKWMEAESSQFQFIPCYCLSLVRTWLSSIMLASLQRCLTACTTSPFINWYTMIYITFGSKPNCTATIWGPIVLLSLSLFLLQTPQLKRLSWSKFCTNWWKLLALIMNFTHMIHPCGRFGKKSAQGWFGAVFHVLQSYIGHLGVAKEQTLLKM